MKDNSFRRMHVYPGSIHFTSTGSHSHLPGQKSWVECHCEGIFHNLNDLISRFVQASNTCELAFFSPLDIVNWKCNEKEQHFPEKGRGLGTKINLKYSNKYSNVYSMNILNIIEPNIQPYFMLFWVEIFQNYWNGDGNINSIWSITINIPINIL